MNYWQCCTANAGIQLLAVRLTELFTCCCNWLQYMALAPCVAFPMVTIATGFAHGEEAVTLSGQPALGTWVLQNSLVSVYWYLQGLPAGTCTASAASPALTFHKRSSCKDLDLTQY